MNGLLTFVMAAALQTAGSTMHSEWRMPLDLPMNLSGNFGQLRTTHFHAGLDIRTNQAIGHKVFAVAGGYVARVRVNIYGYGKVIYVNHPNGKTTVYAHLDQLSNTIAERVEAAWYDKKQYEVDLEFKPWEFPVSGGDVIGLSGNTGGSGGPHLHFEIRDTKTEDVLNPLKHGYAVADTKKPVFTELKLYSLESLGAVDGKSDMAEVPLLKSGSNFVAKSPEITASGLVGIGINAYDPIDLNSFRMGLYKVRVLVNDEMIYGYTLDRFSFDEGKRIAIHCDYQGSISRNDAIEKLWVLPGNDSRQYENGPGSGVIQVEAGKTYHCKILAEDVNGNHSQLEFTIRGVAPTASSLVQKQAGKPFSFVNPDADSLQEKSFTLRILPDALFEDTHISGFPINGLINGELKAWQIGSEKMFLKRDAEIRLDIQDIPQALLAKLYVLNESKRWVPSRIENGSMWLHYPRLGRFSIYADTVLPSLSAIDIGADGRIGKNYTSLFRFRVTDKETDIAAWEAWLNDEFLLLEYEYKDNLLFAKRPNLKSGNNTIKIIVRDGVGNAFEYNNTFIY